MLDCPDCRALVDCFCGAVSLSLKRCGRIVSLVRLHTKCVKINFFRYARGILVYTLLTNGRTRSIRLCDATRDFDLRWKVVQAVLVSGKAILIFNGAS